MVNHFVYAAVVVDNHNLNNVKVREHIIKLFEEQKRDRVAQKNGALQADAQGQGGGGGDGKTSSGSDSDRKQSHRERHKENLYEFMYKYRRALFVFLGALVAFVWRRFVMV